MMKLYIDCSYLYIQRLFWLNEKFKERNRINYRSYLLFSNSKMKFYFWRYRHVKVPFWSCRTSRIDNSGFPDHSWSFPINEDWIVNDALDKYLNPSNHIFSQSDRWYVMTFNTWKETYQSFNNITDIVGWCHYFSIIFEIINKICC